MSRPQSAAQHKSAQQLLGHDAAESFFSRSKKERIRKRAYKSRAMERADGFDYIEVFYNRSRRHCHLGGISPEAFELAAA